MSTLIAWCGVGGALVLGATWIVYPATVYLLSLFTRSPEHEPSVEAMVSVVLATRDAPNEVRRRVRNLRRTDYPTGKLEIVVALDTSGAYDPADFHELDVIEGVHVVAGRAPGGKAATLNGGVDHACGEILVFADTGQRFAPQTIPLLVSSFANPRIGSSSGRLSLRRREGGRSALDHYWRFERWLRQREARLHSPVGVTGAVSAMRASLWEPLPEGLILDDVYTPMRLVLAGHRVAFVKNAVAFETRRPTAAHEHRRKTRTLTGVLQLCAWLPAVLVPWRNPILLQFVFHKLARLLTPYAALLVAVSGAWWLDTSYPQLSSPLAIALALILMWVASGFTAPARSLRTTLVEVVSAQAAVVKATGNGLRGRWDVWE